MSTQKGSQRDQAHSPGLRHSARAIGPPEDAKHRSEEGWDRASAIKHAMGGLLPGITNHHLRNTRPVPTPNPQILPQLVGSQPGPYCPHNSVWYFVAVNGRPWEGETPTPGHTPPRCQPFTSGPPPPPVVNPESSLRDDLATAHCKSHIGAHQGGRRQFELAHACKRDLASTAGPTAGPPALNEASIEQHCRSQLQAGTLPLTLMNPALAMRQKSWWASCGVPPPRCRQAGGAATGAPTTIRPPASEFCSCLVPNSLCENTMAALLAPCSRPSAQQQQQQPQGRTFRPRHAASSLRAPLGSAAAGGRRRRLAAAANGSGGPPEEQQESVSKLVEQLMADPENSARMQRVTDAAQRVAELQVGAPAHPVSFAFDPNALLAARAAAALPFFINHLLVPLL